MKTLIIILFFPLIGWGQSATAVCALDSNGNLLYCYDGKDTTYPMPKVSQVKASHKKTTLVKKSYDCGRKKIIITPPTVVRDSVILTKPL